MEKELYEQLCLIATKLGLYTAKCDGEFCEVESKFIDNFIVGLKEKEILSEDSIDKVYSLVDEELLLDDIIIETKDLLQTLSEKDREAGLLFLTQFMKKVMEIDGVIHPNEIESYNKWEVAFRINS